MEKRRSTPGDLEARGPEEERVEPRDRIVPDRSVGAKVAKPAARLLVEGVRDPG
jgi:hypothetical protein